MSETLIALIRSLRIALGERPAGRLVEEGRADQSPDRRRRRSRRASARSPRPPSSIAKICPDLAAARVARTRSPVSATRSTARSDRRRAGARDEVEDEHEGVHRREEPEQDERRSLAGRSCRGPPRGRSGRARSVAAAPTQIRITTSVTSGPATAILNSSPGDVVSLRVLARPPKNHRSMPSISIPRPRATTAWPSSWRISETKNSSVLTTATR